MKAIRSFREERGWSQAKLAVTAGMDPATLNRLERGKGNPNLKTLEKIAEALSVSIPDLFGGEEAPKAQTPLPLESLIEGDGSGDVRRVLIRFGASLLEGWASSLSEFMESEGTNPASLDPLEASRLLQFSWDLLCTYMDYEEAVEEIGLAEDPSSVEMVQRMDSMWKTTASHLRPILGRLRTDNDFWKIVEAHPDLVKSIESA